MRFKWILVGLLLVLNFRTGWAQEVEALSASSAPNAVNEIEVSAAAIEWGNLLGPNFHEIDKGRFYRSAQLTSGQLRSRLEKYGIKTIINLRGSNPGKDWYDREVDVAREKGVRLVDISMSAQRFPHKSDLITLLDAFESAERPILVHCQAGADRTGEASAIYVMEYMGWPKRRALKMLTLRYHHFALFTPAKRAFIRLYEGTAWAREQYDPCLQAPEEYYKRSYCQKKGALTEGDDGPVGLDSDDSFLDRMMPL